MTTRTYSYIPSTALGCVLALSLFACCHYPKSQTKNLLGTRPAATTITLVAYGDTRTGPWGLGDNEKQAIHGRVVDDIFKNNGSIDAVIFTGDAVMSNFFLWKKGYWQCFLTQTNRFRDHRIPFYPSLGNHEVLPAIVPLLKITPPKAVGFAMPQADIEKNRQTSVALAYDAGEEPKIGRQESESAQQAAPSIDANTKQGRAQWKQLEKAISKGDTEAANKLGQFQNQVQTAFYRQPRDTRCASDAGTFSDDYLTLAKYAYLRPLLQGRSYYSQTVEKDALRIKLIALDTNCLDSEAQQQFFVRELKDFNGPVVVFGHHPPVDYNNPSPWPWDMVPGWDFFKPYLTNAEGKKIALWIFGHVHDYQRRDSSGHAAQTPPPVLLIAGGGGASLDTAPASFQWQPDSWPAPFQASAYQHVKLSVTLTSISVEVRGSPNENEPFQVIDSFSMPLR
jgi:hypothetical protein